MYFWNNVDYLAREQKVEFKTLAGSLGISESKLHLIRKKNIMPRIDEGKKIAALLGVEFTYLVESSSIDVSPAKKIQYLTFNERMTFLLERNKHSFQSLCTYCECDEKILQAAIKGSLCPSADIAVKIADYLGTTVEYLVTGDKKKLINNHGKEINSLLHLRNTYNFNDLLEDLVKSTNKELSMMHTYWRFITKKAE